MQPDRGALPHNKRDAVWEQKRQARVGRAGASQCVAPHRAVPNRRVVPPRRPCEEEHNGEGDQIFGTSTIDNSTFVSGVYEGDSNSGVAMMELDSKWSSQAPF